MMKVLLLMPPSSHVLNEVVSIGLISLATIAKRRGYAVKIIDATAINNLFSNEKVFEESQRFDPDVIGVNLMTPWAANTYKLVRKLKSLDATLVAGGPHATLVPEECLQYGFDIVARGEAEHTFAELLDQLRAAGSLKGVAGITYRAEDGSINKNADRELVMDLDSLPFPDYSILSLKDYSRDHKVPSLFSMITSRSCPSKCIYCANAVLMRGKYRVRSAENVFREMISLKEKYNVKYIRFIDDTLTVKKERIYKLLDLIKSSNELKDVRWECDTRVNYVDADLLKNMKEAGCSGIIYGVESYDQESLKLIKKGLIKKQIRNALEITQKAGIFFNVNIIMGFPWETQKHINNTLNLLDFHHKNCQYPSGIPIPWPGTELYNSSHKKYGFTNWWLDTGNFCESSFVNKVRPYFNRGFYINSIVMTEKNMDLWKFRPEKRRQLYKAMFKFSKRSLKNVQGPIKGLVIYYLCRLSFVLHKTKPELENKVFGFLKNIYRQIKMGKKKILQIMSFNRKTVKSPS